MISGQFFNPPHTQDRFLFSVSLISGDYASLLHDLSGGITPFDLDSSGLYDPNQKSTWVILQRPGSSLVVKIIEMDIEYHASCAFDFLQVRKITVHTYHLRMRLECSICSLNTICFLSHS